MKSESESNEIFRTLREPLFEIFELSPAVSDFFKIVHRLTE